MAWISIDAGTSIIKAVVFDEAGKEVRCARRQTAVLHPEPGFSEQDMQSVWDAAIAVVREVMDCGITVQGLVTTAQGDGCWLVDCDGKPTGNAILWNDARAGVLVDRWQQEGTNAASYRISGSLTFPGLPNAIWSWLNAHQPNRLHAAAHSLTCNGWLHLKLTGRPLAELSDASNPFGAVQSGTYSPELLELYRCTEQSHLLPTLVRGEELIGVLSTVAAEEMGLPMGIPVVMAPYDIVATAYGAGASQAGDACAILGTTIATEVFTRDLDLDVPPSGTTLALEDGLYLRAMPTLTGCEALEWMANILGIGTLDALAALAAQSEPGSKGLFFLPYLSPAGERAPFLDPAACGSLHGMQLSTTRADMARSIYEGLSFVVRECLEAATSNIVEQLHVCGGGSRSDLWCQMLADICGVRVLRASASELGAHGAYLFATALTRMTFSIADSVRKHVTYSATFVPNAALQSVYETRYADFLSLREAQRPHWPIFRRRA